MGHITTSVGWLGAVAAYLVLDVAATSSGDVETARAAFQGMDLTVRYAIVPLALASVVIGIVNALGTSWGLFRHYWVLTKFLLTIAATVVLLLETRTVSAMAESAASGTDPRGLQGSLLHSVGGLVVLVVVVILSVYKPRGMTGYGWRKQQRRRQQERRVAPAPSASDPAPRSQASLGDRR